MRADDIFAEIEALHPEIAEIAHEVDPPFILGLNVMNLRAERGMTQAQLATALGVAQPRIAEIEGGDANPRLLTLAKLAHALGVTLSELLVDNLNADRKRRRERMAEPDVPDPPLDAARRRTG